jgi:hypothetical protein
MIVDLFLVYQFIRRLATPFKEWEAFKLGIIDERGNILKKRSELRTIRERDAFGVFDTLVLRLKRLLEKLPGGQTRIASYAAALWLIKEWNHFSPESLLTEDVSDDLILESIDSFIDHYSHYTRPVENVKEKSDLNESFEAVFLTELFDKPYPFKLVYKGGGSVESITKLPDKTTLRIVFSSKNQPEGQWELFFTRGETTGLTGKGDQQRIFATVLKAIAEFVEKKSPNKIVFTADKDDESTSRMKLYDRLVSRFAGDIGYSSKALTVTGENWAERSYTLTRKMDEDAPTVNVSSGSVAGLGIGPDGEPGLTPRQMRRYKRGGTRKSLRDVVGAKL